MIHILEQNSCLVISMYQLDKNIITFNYHSMLNYLNLNNHLMLRRTIRYYIVINILIKKST